MTERDIGRGRVSTSLKTSTSFLFDIDVWSPSNYVKQWYHSKSNVILVHKIIGSYFITKVLCTDEMSNNLSSYGAWAFCNGHLLLTQQLLLLLLHYSQNHCSSYEMRQESFWARNLQNRTSRTKRVKWNKSTSSKRFTTFKSIPPYPCCVISCAQIIPTSPLLWHAIYANLISHYNITWAQSYARSLAWAWCHYLDKDFT